MTFEEAIGFYKTNRAIGKALELSDARISQIKSDGGFAYPEQCVLEKDSKGELIARKQDAPTTPSKAA
ncbi:hypothetical protein [Neptuniibacter halophilus]|uniref:hypothetical protein n=1 Tax=Neptuniibacter halophilus TaxID=651666 RepID=UPI0025727077|nr:hypothetical protein [Neptuniibacter halophilus]